MDLAKCKHGALYLMPMALILFAFSFIFIPQFLRVYAADPVKSEMYIGDYEFSKDSTGYSEVKYIESVSGKIVKERKAGETSFKKKYYYTDHQGSSVAVLNETGAKIPEQINSKLRYFPYGEQITAQDTTKLPVDDTYTGQKKDSESDLMFYNARLYDPSNGVFLQADSVADGMNKYMYVAGNPVNTTDPTGHRSCDDVSDCEDPYKPPQVKSPIVPKKTTYDDVSAGITSFKTTDDDYLPMYGRLYEIVDYFINNYVSSVDFNDGGDVAVANLWTTYLSSIMDPFLNVYKPGDPSIQFYSNEARDLNAAIEDGVFTNRIQNGNYTEYDILHFSTYVLRNVFNVDARQVEWSTSGGGNYMVVFSDNNVSSNVYYINQGEFDSQSLIDFIGQHPESSGNLTGTMPGVLFEHPSEYYYKNPFGKLEKDSSGNWILNPNERLYNKPITDRDLGEYWKWIEWMDSSSKG